MIAVVPVAPGRRKECPRELLHAREKRARGVEVRDGRGAARNRTHVLGPPGVVPMPIAVLVFLHLSERVGQPVFFTPVYRYFEYGVPGSNFPLPVFPKSPSNCCPTSSLIRNLIFLEFSTRQTYFLIFLIQIIRDFQSSPNPTRSRTSWVRGILSVLEVTRQLLSSTRK